MQVGFIGTGSMGSILIEAFIEARRLQPAQIHISNRTFQKAKNLASKHTGIHAYPTNTRIIERCDLIFLCVKPLEFKSVIDAINPYLKEQQIVVSITSPVQISDLEELMTCKIAKIIPSITNSSGAGASLMVAGQRLTEQDKFFLYQLMSAISHPIWIKEQYTRISSDIVSCGPAFLSYLLQRWLDAAHEETGLSRQEGTALVSQMVVGLGELFKSEKDSLQSLQDRVCVPGGVTGEGLKVLEQETEQLFEQLIQKTHEKYADDKDKVHQSFYGDKA